MSKTLFSMRLGALAVLAVVALPVAADEYDFVGYQYSQEAKRDYDRGFFFGGEAWFAEVRNLHFEPVLSTGGSATGVGGVLLDLDSEYTPTGRYFVGYRGNRRLGTFTLSYWSFSDETTREEVGTGDFQATDTHPSRGMVNTDSFFAAAGTDMEFGEVEWSHEFGHGRKFAGQWSVALSAFDLEYQTDSIHFNESGAPIAGVPGVSAVHVQNVSRAQGVGGRIGAGGTYWFTDHFAVGARTAIGYHSTQQDGFYVDTNETTGDVVAFIAREETDLSTLSYEGELNFHLRAFTGFEIDWGYRFLQFDDVIAQDRFVNGPSSQFTAIEQPSELSFDGPFVNVSYVIGVQKLDSDGDTVLDVYDDCTDTPAGAWVDEKGCPRDLDEDGVYDGIDRCPGTPFGSRVDEFGCGIDADADTVADGLDLCPNTPTCARVDARGCPLDSDGDTVADGCDACPNSTPGRSVNAQGCAAEATDGDSDGDTVPDSRDRCPDSARGAKVDEFGCEQVVEMVLRFETNSARVDPRDFALLDRIADALIADGGTFEVAGHADARSSVEYNQELSERRAASVRDYLISRGVPAASLEAVGYSELRPVASNDSEEGMALNRRVEIVRR